MKRRLIAFVIAAAIMLTISACGSGTKPVLESPSATPAVSTMKPEATPSLEKAEISVVVFDFGRVPPEKGTYEDNDVTKWVNENAPVKVKFVAVPRWETREKYNIMLAAGNAPDIIMEFDPGMVQGFVANGSLLPLGDLIDKHGPNIRKFTPKEVARWGVYNGEEYAIPEMRSEVDVANFMLWIRQDWLKALNLSMPTTTEELLEVAKAFALNDPDKNGKNDTYGFNIAGGEGQIKNIFGARRDSWVPGPDGKLEHASVTENMMYSIKWLKDLYDTGAGDPEFFTDNDKSRANADWVSGKTGIYGTGVGDVNGFYSTLIKNVPTAEIVPVPLPTSSLGKFGYFKERECGLLNMVPTTCKNPEAVVQYLDWQINGAWEPIRNGIEGTHYVKENGVIIPTYTSEILTKDIVYRYRYALLSNYNITADALDTMYSRTDDITRAARHLQGEAVKVSFKEPYTYWTPTDDLGLPLVVEKMPSLKEFADTEWVKCIAAGKDMTPEKTLENIRAEWNKQGYQEIKAEFNKTSEAIKK